MKKIFVFMILSLLILPLGFGSEVKLLAHKTQTDTNFISTENKILAWKVTTDTSIYSDSSKVATINSQLLKICKNPNGYDFTTQELKYLLLGSGYLIIKPEKSFEHHYIVSLLPLIKTAPATKLENFYLSPGNEIKRGPDRIITLSSKIDWAETIFAIFLPGLLLLLCSFLSHRDNRRFSWLQYFLALGLLFALAALETYYYGGFGPLILIIGAFLMIFVEFQRMEYREKKIIHSRSPRVPIRIAPTIKFALILFSFLCAGSAVLISIDALKYYHQGPKVLWQYLLAYAGVSLISVITGKLILHYKHNKFTEITPNPAPL